MEMKKNIALIGAGYWGKNHLKNLYNLGVLHSVLETNDSVIEERKNSHPDVRYVKNDRELLDNEEIRAVVIAAPTALHYALTKKYMLAGKDVLVEKPLALNVREGEELVAIAGAQKRVLMVGHILQYHSAVLKLKELIDSGDIGDIRYIYSNRLNLGKLRVEENVLWSFAPHDISLILMFMNDKVPERVKAFGGAYITDGIYDTTVTEMEFGNGVKGHIYVSWLHPYKEQKLVVIGSEKMTVFDDISDEKLFIYPYKVDFKNGVVPIAQKVQYYTVDIDKKEPLKEELLHFIDCVENRKKPKTDGEEGLRVLNVIETAESFLGH